MFVVFNFDNETYTENQNTYSRTINAHILHSDIIFVVFILTACMACVKVKTIHLNKGFIIFKLFIINCFLAHSYDYQGIVLLTDELSDARLFPNLKGKNKITYLKKHIYCAFKFVRFVSKLQKQIESTIRYIVC